MSEPREQNADYERLNDYERACILWVESLEDGGTGTYEEHPYFDNGVRFWIFVAHSPRPTPAHIDGSAARDD